MSARVTGLSLSKDLNFKNFNNVKLKIGRDLTER
jgi:hypothetical protein